MTSSLTEPHLLQAQANFDFAASLDVAVPVQRQWMCTLFFYAAIHCVEAMANAPRPQRPPTFHPRASHDWAQQWVRFNARHFHERYRHLRDVSQRARYRLFYPTAADVAECRAAATAIVQHTARWLEP